MPRGTQSALMLSKRGARQIWHRQELLQGCLRMLLDLEMPKVFLNSSTCLIITASLNAFPYMNLTKPYSQSFSTCGHFPCLCLLMFDSCASILNSTNALNSSKS